MSFESETFRNARRTFGNSQKYLVVSAEALAVEEPEKDDLVPEELSNVGKDLEGKLHEGVLFSAQVGQHRPTDVGAHRPRLAPQPHLVEKTHTADSKTV